MTEPVFQEDDSKLEVQKRETELLIVSHDILGKEYELGGVSFTVLGMQPVFYGDENEVNDLQTNVVAIADIQSQRVPIIPFQGGYACITKIRIGDEVISGYADVIKYILVTEQTPEGWLTTGALARELKKGFRTIKRIAEQYRTPHPDWFHRYRVVGGQSRNHYSPELCDIIRNKITEEEQSPEGWLTNKALARELKKDFLTIKRIPEQYRTPHPDWFYMYMTASGLQEHFSPELCDIIRNSIAEREQTPEGWLTTGALAEEFKKNDSTIKKIAEQYRTSHPDWFCDYRAMGGQYRSHYSPELCDIIRNRIAEEEQSPEGWLTNKALARELTKDFQAI